MGEKTFCLQVKRWKKNPVPKYYVSSLEEMIKKIWDQLIKNLLIKWNIEEENQDFKRVW